MPISHYENFPVASLLLPANLREPVEAIYAFARSADDIADEGDIPPEKRLNQLATYRSALDDIESGGLPSMCGLPPLFARLARTILNNNLPLKPFYDLLDAFQQDVYKKRFDDFNDLADYCRRSANPIGRLLLMLFNADKSENYSLSDCICTGLQLVNLWQDIADDWKKGRIYLPMQDMANFKVTEEDITASRCDERWQALLSFEVARARSILNTGAPLARRLPGRIGWELRLIVAGGLHILNRIEAVGYDVFARRPRIGHAGKLAVIWRALNYPRQNA
ncbi:MAG: squalene synthase HpnC [Betaproteobacteria bacterium]|nr:squalene synthase HpnC [Betaproteobacteria bacterium]